MNGKLRIALMFAMSGVLGACGADDSEHGHAHDGGAPHTHEPDSNAAADDSEHGHAHGEDTHVHDAADTEAFYGDEAAAAEEAAAGNEHAHGDETHTHDEPDAAQADDEAREPDHD